MLPEPGSDVYMLVPRVAGHRWAVANYGWRAEADGLGSTRTGLLAFLCVH
ncbi:MAG: hypothetical protein QOK10_2592 [Pseudonocardiales bacterium]|nr:hypothetical protein [Pseudonocardiales bacterium]